MRGVWTDGNKIPPQTPTADSSVPPQQFVCYVHGYFLFFSITRPSPSVPPSVRAMSLINRYRSLPREFPTERYSTQYDTWSMHVGMYIYIYGYRVMQKRVVPQPVWCVLGNAKAVQTQSRPEFKCARVPRHVWHKPRWATLRKNVFVASRGIRSVHQYHP